MVPTQEVTCAVTALIRQWVHYLVVSLVANSDLEVCRFPISAKVGPYSCRTTLRRELWT
jgi:hypothetical protein